MMSETEKDEYTPPTSSIRSAYVLTGEVTPKVAELRRAAFDRGMAAHDAEVRAGATADIGFLWDWRTAQGMAFIQHAQDVKAMRELLAGVPLEKVAGFEWVTEARAAIRGASDD